MQDFNYHTHTYRCGHADYSMSDEDYVKELVKKGFKKMAFTDHCPQKRKIDYRNCMRMDYSDKEEYYRSIRHLKEKYKDVIDIQLGFEIEYASCIENDLLELKKETDKLVLGQHFIYDEDSKYFKIIGFDSNTDDDLRLYAKHVKMAMEKGIPDIVVHPDIFMLGRKSFGKVEEEISRVICEVAEKRGIPLEINLTRTNMYLSNRINRIDYPCKEFWKIAGEYDIKVIYGIDAHAKYQIELYEKAIEFINSKVLGKDIIGKLHFLKEF